MWPADQYQLLDFGRGRKLERFGRLILDRPSPAAESWDRAQPTLWSQADLRLSDEETWPAIDDWSVDYRGAVFKLRLTPFGHVGLFPEHEQHWNWLREVTSRTAPTGQLLNLFAYTGGASLAMAAAGWSVVHVDSSAPTVAWARENAAVSNLKAAPIRWIVEDARVFAARELKRGRKYAAILLDPPSYGHGPKGKAWSISRDLPELLDMCCQLLAQGGTLMLTGHSAQLPFPKSHLQKCLRLHGHGLETVADGRTSLSDLSGRKLDFGWYLRATTK